MKYAILADLHLTNPHNLPKQSALAWAISRIKAIQPDAVVTIGDMTATGTECQAAPILKALASTGIPYYATPGNAEYRTKNPQCIQAFNLEAPKPLLLVNSALGFLPHEDLDKINALPANAHVLLATHTPVEQWPAEQQAIIHNARQRQAISAVIAGHSHQDGESVMRGLDPDKATGGVPAFEIWEQNLAGDWTRHREEMPGVAPEHWSSQERKAFRNCLGVSCMYDCLGNLASATLLGIRNIELRASAVFETDQNKLQEAVAAWRQRNPESCLSLHATNLTVDDTSQLELSVQAALQLQCNRITLHVPAVTAAAFPNVKAQLLQNFLRVCTPLLEQNIAIGIENLHTRPPKELTPETRNYGCTIQECQDWIQTLRQATHSPLIGFHLDIGHARNNAPFSSQEYISDWLCQFAQNINGMHLHQVTQNNDGSFKNHRKLTGFYTKLIALSGLFIAYRQGVIAPNTPMFLEITENDAGIDCWKYLTNQIHID